MKNIVVNIVRGAWGWMALGVPNRPPGRPGGFQLYYYLLHFGHFGVSGTLLGRSGGVCGLSGRLRGAPGGTLETFWELLGSSGSTFWEYFLNAKQFFAVSDWKAYAKRVST